jgi:hypothetical protein
MGVFYPRMDSNLGGQVNATQARLLFAYENNNPDFT